MLKRSFVLGYIIRRTSRLFR